MILIDRVNKTYEKHSQQSLKDVSLSVQPGEFVVIVGKSGAGKSTLLKLLNREITPTSGKIVVGGVDYDNLTDKEIPLLRRRIGTVFQDFKLLPKLTAYENVAFALEISGAVKREIDVIVPRILDLVGLRDKADKFPHELSGGEKQRVAIARAMVRQPKILIADEPTGNLDVENAAEVIDLLLKLNSYGTTVLLVTHDVNLVKKLGKRVLTIQHGSIIDDSTAKIKPEGVNR